MSRLVPRAAGIAAAGALLLAAPAAVSAHGLLPQYQSPLPLAVYLAGAAATVALSFVFVLARNVREAPPADGPLVRVPGVVRHGLRAIGLVGWLWIVAQAIAGGSSLGAVASLFLWVYGWVGLAMLSSVVGPVWQWLDPFTTLYELLAWPLRRLGLRGWAPAELPRGLRTWPAVAGLAVVIWLELVLVPDGGTLAVFLVGYTLVTLGAMAQFGRDAWRAHGETFSVWFAVLGRLAPYAAVPATDADPDADPDAVDPVLVRRRPLASGLFAASWTVPAIVLVALGTGSIIWDGLSQTVVFADTVGSPPLGTRTLLLAGFLGLVAGLALLVARTVSRGAIGAGLLPIAVGYLFAHYLTYVLIDGQRIVVALSDPLQLGWDLFGTAFHEPDGEWLPPGLVWTVQLGAVVVGHMLGAWAGHVTAARDAEAAASGRRDLRHRRVAAGPPRNVRLREVPLALVMVGLTTLTLWSLGQAIVVEERGEGAAVVVAEPGG